MSKPIYSSVPHQQRNLSVDEPAYAVVARNDSNEQENVVLYAPALERIKGG